MFLPLPKNTLHRMKLSPFAREHDETVAARAQPNACPIRSLTCASVSFPWHLSPVAADYDRCYWNCLNLNEQLPHYSPADSSAATCAALQWIWGAAGKNVDSVDSNVCDGLD